MIQRPVTLSDLPGFVTVSRGVGRSYHLEKVIEATPMQTFLNENQKDS
jgi:hypothetical protein